MVSSNGFMKPYPEPKSPKIDKNVDRSDGDSLPEPQLSRQQKKNIEKFEKEMEKNKRY